MLLTLIAAEAEHNVLIPALPDLIWGTVTFVILFVVFKKYAIPRINQITEERAQKIEGGLARAEQAQAEAAKALAEYQAQLAAGRTEAAQIRAAAADEKRQLIEAARAEATAAATEVARRAHEQVEAERGQVVTSLQKEVGALAVDLASRIVGATLKDDERAKAVVDQFIADLERQASEAGR